MNLSAKKKDWAKRVLETLEFDAARYDKCANMDALDWGGSLRFRSLLRHTHLGPENRKKSGPGALLADGTLLTEEEITDELIRQILEDPLPPKRRRGPTWPRKKSTSVSDANVYDLWTGPEILKDFPEAVEACKQLDTIMCADHWVSSDDYPKLPFESVHSYRLRKGAWNYGTNYPAVCVNLEASDEILKDAFAHWLSEKRKELKSHGLRSVRTKRFTDVDFRKWHEHRVLAYIDLVDLLAYHFDAPLTDEMIARCLFPTADVDTSERVRKTVRPLAKMLMSSQAIQLLINQADEDFYSQNPEESDA